MRIAVNTRMLLKERMEGIGRYVYHTTKEMVLTHPDDEFFFFFDRPFSEDFVFADNVTPIVIGLPARHPLLFIAWFEWSLYKALKKYEIDVVYSGDSYLSLRSSIPTVLVSHDLAYRHYPEHISFINRIYYRLFFKRFHQKAFKIIAVSNATKNDIIEQYNIVPSKIDIAYNDTDGGFRKMTTETQTTIKEEYSLGKPFFLYLGAIHPRKNIINLIKGFELFKKNKGTDHQLLLLGRKAWGTTEMDKIYTNSPFMHEIHFLGAMDKGREKLMGSAEALVYISLFEGFGVPILEAMDAEIPIICSNVSSMPEVAGKGAIQVDPMSQDEIADAMYKITNDKSLVAELKQSAILQRKKFNWKDSSGVIYRALTEAIA